ncbi:hypothetical protein Poli38472_011726 [Pythium oligandrum]|uniref:Uncharacterized protein n=1 Tax=Pythium oligandrum TaxID=41045 RepID=A0A8K1FGV7_PYTOL|nr:hypothetical protein Poli38472_011726 [Pythium oligandrum]|eukprot:TMW58138.1 hypothetical protein Poli38472_011726 [Pythium oligandrum]
MPGSKDQCPSCHALRVELGQLRVASGQRAREDEMRCRVMYERMEQLARLNTLLVSRSHVSGKADIALARSSITHVEEKKTSRSSEPANAQYLQSLVVQQAKQIEKLRAQLKTMAPIVPMDGSRHVPHDNNEDDDEEDAEELQGLTATQPTTIPTWKERKQEMAKRKLPLTSLCAQLSLRERQIHQLQQYIARLEAQLTVCLEKKRDVTQQYQQITQTQQAQLRKYLAVIKKHVETQKRLEYEHKETKQYVGVLEKKLLTVGSNDQRCALSKDDEKWARDLVLYRPLALLPRENALKNPHEAPVIAYRGISGA